MTMPFKESNLNKGQLRKFNAYRKSVGGNEDAAQAMMQIYLDNLPIKQKPEPKINPALALIEDALSKAFPDIGKIKLPQKGVTVNKGKGANKGKLVVKENK